MALLAKSCRSTRSNFAAVEGVPSNTSEAHAPKTSRGSSLADPGEAAERPRSLQDWVMLGATARHRPSSRTSSSIPPATVDHQSVAASSVMCHGQSTQFNGTSSGGDLQAMRGSEKRPSLADHIAFAKRSRAKLDTPGPPSAAFALPPSGLSLAIQLEPTQELPPEMPSHSQSPEPTQELQPAEHMLQICVGTQPSNVRICSFEMASAQCKLPKQGNLTTAGKCSSQQQTKAGNSDHEIAGQIQVLGGNGSSPNMPKGFLTSPGNNASPTVPSTPGTNGSNNRHISHIATPGKHGDSLHEVTPDKTSPPHQTSPVVGANATTPCAAYATPHSTPGRNSPLSKSDVKAAAEAFDSTLTDLQQGRHPKTLDHGVLPHLSRTSADVTEESAEDEQKNPFFAMIEERAVQGVRRVLAAELLARQQGKRHEAAAMVHQALMGVI